MKEALYFLLLLFIVSSCGETVRGEGDIIVEERGQFDFKSIEISGINKAIIEPETSNTSKPVSVETEANLQEYILVENHGERLVIRVKKGFKLKSKKILVRLRSGNEIKLTNNGHTDVTVEPFQNIDLNYSGNGSGDLSCQASIHSAEVRQNGSGDCTFDEAIQMNLEASISGSGSMTFQEDVMAPAQLQLSGSGNYVFEKRVGNMTIDKSGSGDISALQAKSEEASIQSSGSGNTEVFVTKLLNVTLSGSGDVKYKGNPKIIKSITGSGKVIKLD